MSRLYETMYILRPDLNEQDLETAIAKYKTLLEEKGAEEISIQNRGKRRLAYEVKKNREGIYVQLNYTAPPVAVETLERTMKLSDEVIRFMTIKVTPEQLAAADQPVEIVAEPIAMQRGPGAMDI
ncbi:ribosomal protein S6 [Synechococcus sp. PCC 7502]|uniref:30S ribosomal protein S6 n=1 Tax=Synechococcus sp. PCC 7502 TaxID=1173263 RepID=UPI00029FE8BD|nr:30S ribosomal protein S6 [Synechococcus sp. PCC 7502]AFY74235.1 ribosomal protein S6 [Synechococcus sp. PCC 7502]